MVFPACVGMNRTGLLTVPANYSVPRVCGDEPWLLDCVDAHEVCSPRVWG